MHLFVCAFPAWQTPTLTFRCLPGVEGDVRCVGGGGGDDWDEEDAEADGGDGSPPLLDLPRPCRWVLVKMSRWGTKRWAAEEFVKDLLFIPVSVCLSFFGLVGVPEVVGMKIEWRLALCLSVCVSFYVCVCTVFSSLFFSVCVSMYLFASVCVCLSICLYVCLFVCLSYPLLVFPAVCHCAFFCLPVYLCLFVYLSVFFCLWIVCQMLFLLSVLEWFYVFLSAVCLCLWSGSILRCICLYICLLVSVSV